jgi:hypothetical protein
MSGHLPEARGRSPCSAGSALALKPLAYGPQVVPVSTGPELEEGESTSLVGLDGPLAYAEVGCHLLLRDQAADIIRCRAGGSCRWSVAVKVRRRTGNARSPGAVGQTGYFVVAGFWTRRTDHLPIAPNRRSFWV